MNRKQRRALNKGDLETRTNKVDEADKALRQKEQAINSYIIQQGKAFASSIVQTEFMAICRDTLHGDLKASDEQIAIFEEKFKERFSKRLEGLGKQDEKSDTESQNAESIPAEGDKVDEPAGVSTEGDQEATA